MTVVLAFAGFVLVITGAHSGWFSPAASGTAGWAGLAETDAGGDPFARERLAAFSGTDFNLRPGLANWLDTLRTRLRGGGDPDLARRLDRYRTFIKPGAVSFEIYTIQRGDNLWILAKRRGYTIDTIIGCNPGISETLCRTGQRILLPSRGGSLHRVREGERLETVALDYRVASEDIRAANLIDPAWGLVPGMWIFVPGAKPLYLNHEMRGEFEKRSLFRSPLAGRYTSFVGMRNHPVLGFSKFHNGVDIACPMRTWVGAAASGNVIYAGWGGAVGKYVKIDHHNGYKTVYGHLDAIYVRKGDRVRAGQLIARSGKTGRVTGPHLHFTIYERGRVVDPMDFLW